MSTTASRTGRTTSCDDASTETRAILETEPFQANVFSAWSDGYGAGLADLDALSHRAYERGKRDAENQPAVTWLVLCGACLIAGLLIGIIGFAG